MIKTSIDSLRLLVFFILLFVLSGIASYSNERATDFSLTGGIGLGINIYNSDFGQLPGIPNCCTKFESAYGLGYDAFIGGEYKFGELLKDFPSKYALRLRFSNLSAGYKVEEYIGNLLHLDNYEEVWTDHRLDVNYLAILTEHFYQFSQKSFIPLEFRLGLSFGVVIESSFEQKEEISRPKGINFGNQLPVLNDYSGDLPNSSTLYAGLVIGASYKATTIGKYEVLADIQYTHGLTNVIESYNWNISAFRVGVTLRRNIEKAEPPRPVVIPPDEPALPPPPRKPEPPVIALKSIYENRELSSGDTLVATVKRDNFIYYLNYLPVLFFEKNRTKPIERSIILESGLSDDEKNFFNVLTQNDFAVNYIDIIAEKLQREINSVLTINSVSIDDETDIIEKRALIIKEQLIAKGISNNRIKINTEKSVKNNFRYTELIDESRRISFEFDGKEKLIEHYIETNRLIHNINKVIFFQPIIKSESEITEFQGFTTIEGGNPTKLNPGENELLLNSSMFVAKDGKLKTLKAYAKIKNSDDLQASDSMFFYLKHTEIINDIYINSADNLSRFSYFILAYSGFDRSDFYAYDNTAMKYIKSKIAEGKRITIYPLTDDLGTVDYNIALARRRGDSAARLLGITQTQYDMELEPPVKFNKQTSYGRILSRGVIVRVNE